MVRSSSPPPILPNRIRALRKERGLTIRQLADQVGLSQPMLGFLETGDRELKYAHQVRIARALGVYAADLLNDSDHSEVYTHDERQLLADYRALDASGRRAVRGVAESLSSYGPPPADDQSDAANDRNAA